MGIRVKKHFANWAVYLKTPPACLDSLSRKGRSEWVQTLFRVRLAQFLKPRFYGSPSAASMSVPGDVREIE